MMRLSRAAFWRILLLNVFVVTTATAFLPQAAKPFTAQIAFLLCLPSGWMGMQRLHDVGHPGWQSWLPLIPLVGVAAFPFAQKLFWATMVNGDAQNLFAPLARFGVPIMIALWLSVLLLAAGVVRTFFLWLEPSEAGDNRYGPPPAESTTSAPPAIILLKGRMGRLLFWLLLFGNYALVAGLRYVAAHLPDGDGHPMMISLNPISALLYLPTFAAAVLRLHDRGRPGTWVVFAFLINAAAPFAESYLDATGINLMNVAIDFVTFYLLFQCWQPGDPGTNRYDPPCEQSLPKAAPQVPSRPAASTNAAIAPTARLATPRSFGRRTS